MKQQGSGLDVAVLEAPDVRFDGRRLTFPTRKTLALLIYLAVEGGPQRRDSLAVLLWPDSDEEHARRSLRITLTFLRAVMREAGGDRWLTADRDTVELAGSPFALDLDVLCRGYESARRPGGPDVPALPAASQVYRGDFLAGFSLPDAPEFDTWVSLQRELSYRRAETVFERLTQTLADAGDLAAAIEAAARRLAHDPLSEGAYRSLMRLYLAADNRGAALQAYHACRRMLADELGAEPSPETEALAARIRHIRDARPPRTRGRAAGGIAAIPFVGRGEEHARLMAEFRLAGREGPRFIVLEGDAGIGKSRLLQAFLRSARAEGAEILIGRGYEVGGRPPFHPLVEALTPAIDGVTHLEDLLPDVWLAELSRLLLQVRERRPDLPARTTPWEEGSGQGRLYEALARLLLALTRDAPIVLSIDDLQWADAATLDVLPFLFRRFSGMPLLVILAVRSGEVSETAGPHDWLRALRQEFPATTIELGPLHDEDTGRLVGSLLNRPAGLETPDVPIVPAALAPLAEWVTAQAGGYPLFVVETVRGLIERGVLRYDPAEGWQPGTNLTSELRDFIAPRVREIIEGRVARLGDAAQRMAKAAAVLGGGTTFASLWAVARMDEEEALAALDNLVEHHILRETGGYYWFSHDLIRQAVYRRVGEARRIVWHRRALDVLSGEGRPASELVPHALAANLTRRSAELSVAAGDEALRLFAAQDAVAHYQTALRLARDSQQRAHLAAQLGAAYVLASDYHSAREMFAELVRLAREEGNLTRECAGLNRLADVAAHELNFELQARL
ncbi:MAG: AAA family ATPase, partial [Chloroflexi bacterium]|nr:AAA family ATPase [Chloroflexota bacterium]